MWGTLSVTKVVADAAEGVAAAGDSATLESVADWQPV
jgi:hypothetical protein